MRRVGVANGVYAENISTAAHNALHAHTEGFMQDNLKKKYGITDEDLKDAVDQIQFGKIACDGVVLVALVDLICTGDIQPPKEQER